MDTMKTCLYCEGRLGSAYIDHGFCRLSCRDNYREKVMKEGINCPICNANMILIRHKKDIRFHCHNDSYQHGHMFFVTLDEYILQKIAEEVWCKPFQRKLLYGKE